MLSDVLGRSRATLALSTSFLFDALWGVGVGWWLAQVSCHRVPAPRRLPHQPLVGDRWELSETEPCWGSTIAIIRLERGIPSKRTSPACIEFVSALCTHRPSLLPIEWFSEYPGGECRVWCASVHLPGPRTASNCII